MSSMPATVAPPQPRQGQPSRHLMVIVSQDGASRGYRVLDLTDGGYPPLVKELSYRAVVAAPQLAGSPWQLSAALEQEGQALFLVLKALAGEAPGSRPALAGLRVPLENLAWIGLDIGKQLALKGHCKVLFAVLPPDHPNVRNWKAEVETDPDFDVAACAPAPLRLPDQFVAQAPGPRRVIRRENAYLRCVFTPRAFRAFVEAARAEQSVERAWLAPTQLHLPPGGPCYAVIEEILDLPAVREREWLHARGRDFLALHNRLGRRLGAFLHLHPPAIENQPMTPNPSAPDVTVAWDLECAAVGALPLVFPIALFGPRALPLAKCLAAHTFVNGVLAPIDVEVLQ